MYKSIAAKWVCIFQLLLSCLCYSSAFAKENIEDPCDSSSRYLYWTGEENSDFFNEKNWRITNEKPTDPTVANGVSGKPACLPGENSFLYSICSNEPDPEKDRYLKEGTLEPGLPIRYNLFVETANVVANRVTVFACDQKGITLINAQLKVAQGTITQGVVSLFNESTVHLQEGDFSPQLSLNFLDAVSCVYLHQENPDEFR